MNELQIFNNEDFGEIRTVTINNEPYFVGKDVASALGYSDTRKAVSMHVDEDDKTICPIKDSVGRNQDTTCINESGMYSLILSSKLPSAKKFKHWVTSEVLPSIRKTGGYNLPTTYKDALQQLLIQVEENEKLALENTEMKPKADFYDCVTDSKDAIQMADVAKVLAFKNIGRNKLFNYLRNKKVLQEDNKPYQRYIDNGWFRTVESKYTDSKGNTHINITTLVYQKGVDGIRKMLVKDYKGGE